MVRLGRVQARVALDPPPVSGGSDHEKQQGR